MKGKQLALIFLLVFGGMLAYQMLTHEPESELPPQEETPTTQTAATQPTTASAPAAPAKTPAKPKVAIPKLPVVKPSTATLGSLNPEDGYLMQITLTSQQAAIESAKLTHFFETVEDKQLFKKLGDDEAAFQAEVAKNPETYKGHYTAIKTVRYGGHEYMPYGTPTLRMYRKVENSEQPFEQRPWENKPFVKFQLKNVNWVLADQQQTEDSQTTVWEHTIQRWNSDLATPGWQKVLTLRKIFTLKKGSYSVDVKIQTINFDQTPLKAEMVHTGPVGLDRQGIRADERYAIVLHDEDDSLNRTAYGVKDLAKADYGNPRELGATADSKAVLWLACTNKYFGSVLYLQPENADAMVAREYDANFTITPVQESDWKSNGETGRMWLPEMSLASPMNSADQANKEFGYSLNVFIGPKDQKLFSKTPLYSKLHYVETIVSSSCFCTIDWLRDGLMWLLGVFANHLFFGNFGLAIMLLVVIVRACLHPLTKRGQVKMAGMQKQMAALKPEMERIKKKYANDKAVMNQKMMALYKEHGNPMSGMLGCLPMLLQMPIWIALFSGLNSNVHLRHAAFLPFWITDLAAPDRLINFGASYPLIGQYFNLLPILVAIAMLAQMKLNPSMGGGATMTPEQQQQQKMMKWLMPIMMLFFFYQMPSGLNLYIMASTAVGVCEQYVIRKHIREKEEAQANTETVVQVTGKAPRNARPKKPKGPMWFKRP